MPLTEPGPAGCGMSGQYHRRSICEREDSDTLLWGIIEFYPDAMTVIDDLDTVIAWNKAMEKLTGVSAEEMIGKGDFEYALPFYGEGGPVLLDMPRPATAPHATGYMAAGWKPRC